MWKAVLAVVLAGLVLVIGALTSVGGAPHAERPVTVTPRPSVVTATAEVTPDALVGDPVRGQQIFTQGYNHAPPCATCHATTSGRQVFALAPNLVSIGERAATRVDGLSAEEYLHQSIVEPDAYFVGGFRPIMPPNFASFFGEQEIADLVAYLMTL